MSLAKERTTLFLSVFKCLFVKLKLESEFLEEPLVFARLVPERKMKFQLQSKRTCDFMLNPQLTCSQTDLSSNLTLASRLALRLRAGSLNTSLLTTVLSRGMSTEYLKEAHLSGHMTQDHPGIVPGKHQFKAQRGDTSQVLTFNCLFMNWKFHINGFFSIH